MLTIEAPAKINLTLEVLGKRQDGYHEIRSVMQAINLCDRLHFKSGESIEFRSSTPDWNPEESLVLRAVDLLCETTGCILGATIEVEKRIPMMAGLGGDSSDAAAVLRGLNELWGLGLSRDDLLGLAPRLGSDVAFFIYGGTALAEGRGERVTLLSPLPHRWVVLVVPSVSRVPGKTRRLYARLNASHYTDGEITGRLVEELKTGGKFTPSLLFNTFENVSFTRSSRLSVYRSHIAKIGATNVHLAGSGPALFSILEDRDEAEDLYTRIRDQGMECYLTDTAGARKSVE
jgi:4-diphosphocytidyl-2-C-methyl-D-erythritol kinase